MHQNLLISTSYVFFLTVWLLKKISSFLRNLRTGLYIRLLTLLHQEIIFQERIVMHQRTDCISRPWCTLIHWHPCVRARDTNKSQLGSTARGQKVHGAPLSCHSAQNYTQMLQKRHHDEYKGEQKFKSHYNLSC